MAAGVTTRLYDVADLVALLVESESKSRVGWVDTNYRSVRTEGRSPR